MQITHTITRKGPSVMHNWSQREWSACRALLMFGLLAAACSATGNAAEFEFPPEMVDFVPAAENPIFQGAGAGHWDVKIRERGWILREEDGYHMWYTGYDGTRSGIKRLGYATSDDGIRWKRHSGNPIYSEHWTEDVMVIKRDGTYYMFAEGRGDQPFLLTSTDKLQWTHRGTLDIRKTDGTPIEAGPRGTPTAWYERGTWYLFFERRDLGIWLATSNDLQVWTQVQDDPVIGIGPGKYDEKAVALNQIVKHAGRYYAHYHGSALDRKPALWTTNVAVSDDLIHWTKYARNPLFPVKNDKSSGILVHDGTRYRQYTMHQFVNLHYPRSEPDR